MGDPSVCDHSIFDQLLEMDEDDQEREFSRGIVVNYFEQAETTFQSMTASLQANDLGALSRYGHFLKGSSAALGLTKVRMSCEKLQNYGALKDEAGNPMSEEDALARIRETLERAKAEHKEAEEYLRKLYGGTLA
ncbi:hypothetical protein HK101_005019 [Irineochytrium annulatum]|nr:hypothetical protein HK101_005019 [Irineochytrium annulatum]